MMTDNGMCSCNRSRDYDELKERYEKLEQVAKRMFAALLVNEVCSMEFIDEEGNCGIFKEQLGALGVKVDG